LRERSAVIELVIGFDPARSYSSIPMLRRALASGPSPRPGLEAPRRGARPPRRPAS
jgi:hypothetical protein